MSEQARIAEPWPRAAWIGGGIAVLLVASAVALWAWFGSTVFFEVIAAGIAACF
jgi:hypothetical protein